MLTSAKENCKKKHPCKPIINLQLPWTGPKANTGTCYNSITWSKIIFHFKGTVIDTYCSGFYNCFSTDGTNARKCLKISRRSWVNIYILLACRHLIDLFHAAKRQTINNIVTAGLQCNISGEKSVLYLEGTRNLS